MKQQDLRNMTLEEMTEWLRKLGQPAFRAKQLFAWIHQKQIAEIQEMHNLGKVLLALLEEQAMITSCILQRRQISKDGTEKYLFALNDGNQIECVLMRYRGDLSKQRNTLCVSSQVGCAMGCTFCATGQGGFVRNLTAGEIVSQVYEVNRLLRQEGELLPVGNVVFMGMGEPLLNWNAVKKGMGLLHHMQGQNIGMRRFTVSTCGIVPKLRVLAEEQPQFVLAVSLHAPNNTQRSSIMPVNQRYPLQELIKACRYYQQKTQNRISFEYALIAGFNNEMQHVQQLKQLLYGLDCHINVIPVNPVANTAVFTRPNKKQVTTFLQLLQHAGLNASVREEKGTDIDGACGQLRGKVLQ